MFDPPGYLPIDRLKTPGLGLSIAAAGSATITAIEDAVTAANTGGRSN
jgi:hypothetical protein